jgi:exodeoxyribonuclease VII large subunit
MLETLRRRWPAVEVWVCPVRVQGEGAALEMASALGLLNRLAGPGSARPIDVLLLGRGGGSLEDLWPFNEEVLAEALFASRIPVVTGIGHEDDLTIADMVADERAETPTAAAARVVPDRAEVLEALAGVEGRLRALLRQSLEAARARLAELASRPCLRRPLERVRDCERRLDEWGERLCRAVLRRLEQARQRLEAGAGRLETLSPLNVLRRGYTLTRRVEDRSVVRSAAQVRPGDWVVTHLADGRLLSRVETVTPEGEPSNGLPAPAELPRG